MAEKKIDVNARVSPKFVEDMRNASLERIRRGLANPLKRDEIGFREMTELITKTSGYQKVIEELKTKPKRKNII